MILDKFDTVIIFDHAIGVDEALFALYTHPVFGDEARQVAVVVTDIDQAIVNTFFVDFPTAVRIHFAFRPDIVIEVIIRHRFIRQAFCAFFFHDAPRLIVIDPQNVDGIMFDEFQFRLRIFR